MTAIRSRKFFCCLPVRLGVFVLSLLAMVGGSFVAAVGWIKVSQLDKNPLEKMDEIALYVHAVMFTILGLLSVFGFLGTLTKSRRMVSSFAIALAIHLGFSIASGAFTLYSIFHEKTADAVARCLNETSDASATAETCRTAVGVMKGVMVAIYVLTWLIQLYAYFIVERYVAQLDDEAMADNTVVIPRTAAAEDVGAPMMMNTTYGSFAPSYAFTAPGQAFGSAHGPTSGVAGITRVRDGSNIV